MSVQAWPEYPTIRETFTQNGIRAQGVAVSHKAQFGPFAAAFSGGEYLELLGLHSSVAAQNALSCVESALQHGDSERWIAALPRDMNWRPNLVGAVALLLDPTAADAGLLWEAIDRGSWVVPQVVIAAAIVDPRFRERIRARVEATTSGKLAASALAICAEYPDLAPWRADRLRDRRVIAQLAEDAGWNNSGGIVKHWLAQLRTVFAERARVVQLQ